MCQVHTGYETCYKDTNWITVALTREKKKKILPLSYLDLCCNITQCFLRCSHNTVFCKTSSKEWDARHIDIHSTSIFVVLTLDEGLSASVLVPVTGPLVIF